MGQEAAGVDGQHRWRSTGTSRRRLGSGQGRTRGTEREVAASIADLRLVAVSTAEVLVKLMGRSPEA